MTFYDETKLEEFGKYVQNYEPDGVIIIVGIANVENETVDFNFVSRLPPNMAIECLEEYVQHLKQEHIVESLGSKPDLKIIRE